MGLFKTSPGATLIDVHVTLVDEGTNQKLEQTTNEEGFFEFLALPLASYSVEVEHPGFKKDVIENVALQVAQTESSTVTLQLERKLDGARAADWEQGNPAVMVRRPRTSSGKFRSWVECGPQKTNRAESWMIRGDLAALKAPKVGLTCCPAGLNRAEASMPENWV